MGKINNSMDTLLTQLETLCESAEQKTRMNVIWDEYKIKDKVVKTKKENKELYAILHLTRCLDSSLQLFLKVREIPDNGHSLGEYLKKLTNHNKVADTAKLPENLRKRFQQEIVDKRNIYMHSSGKFPNKRELENIESDITFCLQTVLGLVKM